jgi:hypothetical protein
MRDIETLAKTLTLFGGTVMKSQRWIMMIAVLVFAVVLGTGGSARAQWGFPGDFGSPGVSAFGLGHGVAPGFSPFNYGYGYFGATGFGGPSNFIGFPIPGYAAAVGLVPQTTTSFPAMSSAVTLVPGWGGSAHRVRRHRR